MNTKQYSVHSDLIEDIILNNISIKKNWLEIKYRFDNIYPTFFLEYLKKGIQLTVSEEKYLILEKIGMNQRTISKVLGVLPESIYTLKYRLHKKIKSFNI